MTLSERLMKLTEEKTRLECENQRLRAACRLRDKCIDDLLKENKEVRAAKRVFEGCGEYIYLHQNEFAIFKFDIEKLGLHCYCKRDCKQQTPNNTTVNDDILDLFKQFSNDTQKPFK